MSTITFYSTSKRHNSTLVPTAGSDYSVELKGGSDLLDPVLLYHTASVPNASMFKFAGRYYFLTGIKSVRNDLWEISGHVDVLATYKSNIQAASPYVAYYTHNNTEISDKRLSTKTTKSTQIQTGAFDVLGNGTGTNFAVALNVVGDDACVTYITDQTNARELLNNLDEWFDNTGAYTSDGSGILDSSDPGFSWASVEDAIRSFFDETVYFWKQWFATGKAADNIRSAYILPLPVSAIGGYSDQIKLGKYDTHKNAIRISDRIFSDGATVSIPWQATDWRRNAPYHELYLYIPYIGLVTLSPSDLIGDSALNVSVSIDIPSGDAVFTVYTGTNRFIGQYTTNMAAAFAIGTSNIPPASMVNSVVQSGVEVGAAVATGGASAVIGASAGGIANMGNILSGMPTAIGANMGGAVLGVTDNIVCYSIFHDTTVSPGSVSAEKGTPYNGVLSLSGVSGYVQTIGASVAGSMTDTERQEINRLMDGGIFIE